MKKMYLLILVAFSFIATCLNAQFTTRWEKSASTSVEAAPIGLRWLLTSGDRASSLAYNKATGNLLVAVRGVSAVAPVNPTIVVLNALTGDSITSLNVTGIPSIGFGLAHNFQKVRVDDNGVIYALSLCTASASNTPPNSAILRVLRWANQTATPTECARFNVSERVGDAFGLSGTGANTILYAAGNATTGGTTSPNFTGSIYALTTTDGINFNTLNTITIPLGSSNAHWGRGALEPITNSLTSDIWVKASSLPARRLTLTGTAPNFTATAAFTSADGTGNGQFANTFSQMGFLNTPDGKKYLAGCSGAATNNTHLFKMINVTSEAGPADVFTDNLSNSPVNANSNASGDVAFKANGDGTYDIFYLSTNNGVKCLTTTITLPVSLSSFAGSIKDGIASLTWKTDNEINNKGFEIEKSFNGSDFSTIGFVAAGENASNTYSFSESKNLAANNYYRLKQVDKDGKYTRSSVILLQNKTNIQQLVLFGNVVKSQLNAQIEATKTGASSIAIVDMSGKVVKTIQKQLQKGTNQVSFNVSGLQAGNYQLQIATTEGRTSARFVVAK